MKTPVMNKLVKKLTKKDGGKKQLNAGEARRVTKSFLSLYVTDTDFAILFDEAVNEARVNLVR